MNNLYVIDGNNICHEMAKLTQVDGDLSIQPLISIISALQKNDDDFICIFDANILVKLDEFDRGQERKILKSFINSYPDRFKVVNPSTRADSLILAEAEERVCEIISNDRYRDYINRYGWIADQAANRVLRFNLTNNSVIFDNHLTYFNVPFLPHINEVAKSIRSNIRSSPPNYASEKPKDNRESVMEKRRLEIKDAVEQNLKLKKDLEDLRLRRESEMLKKEASDVKIERGLDYMLGTVVFFVMPILILCGGVLSYKEIKK